MDLVAETLEFDGGRQVTAYVPVATPEAVVFAGDGGSVCPRHPDIYGAALCASPGAGYRPPAVLPAPLPRVYLVAGTSEPFFLDNATRWADALRDAGGDVVLTQRAGSHGDVFWKREFPLMVAWALTG